MRDIYTISNTIYRIVYVCLYLNVSFFKQLSIYNIVLKKELYFNRYTKYIENREKMKLNAGWRWPEIGFSNQLYSIRKKNHFFLFLLGYSFPFTQYFVYFMHLKCETVNLCVQRFSRLPDFPHDNFLKALLLLLLLQWKLFIDSHRQRKNKIEKLIPFSFSFSYSLICSYY